MSENNEVAMQIIITEQDYRDALGSAAAKRLTSEKEEILGPDDKASVIDALPRVLADRLKKMIPVDYDLLEIQMKITLSGTPFGVGVGGDAIAKFGPKSSHK